MKKAIITVIKILIFFIGWAILSGIIEIPSDDPAIWRLWAEIIPFIVISVFTLIFLIIEKGEVKIPVIKNICKGAVIGVIVGILWLGLSSVLLFASHHLVLSSEKNSIQKIGIWILAAFINVIMQELLVRGYIYQLLKTKYNLTTAVIVTTLLFTLMHGGAFEAGIIPVINVVTMYLFTTALYESEKTIAAPIMAHSVWNIIGSVMLGEVSLADDYPNIYSVSASDNIILSGGEYKIEASIVVTVINIMLMALFCYRCKRQQDT